MVGKMAVETLPQLEEGACNNGLFSLVQSEAEKAARNQKEL